MVFVEVMMKDIAEDEKKYIKTWIAVSRKFFEIIIFYTKKNQVRFLKNSKERTKVKSLKQTKNKKSEKLIHIFLSNLLLDYVNTTLIPR